MKTNLKKSIACILAVIMLVLSAPLRGLDELNSLDLFASEASASLITSSTHIGVLEGYEATIAFSNGASYECVDCVTIDGRTYLVRDKELISLSNAESLKNNRVIFTVENNILVSISKFAVSYTEPNIACNSTSIKYKDGWFSKKKFSITGTVSNQLSRSDMNIREVASNYYNSKGINQLTDIQITLKSPDIDKIYFDAGILNGKQAEITFPLKRTIGASLVSSFDYDIYVNRDYCPPSGSEDVKIECILSGYLNGYKIESVHSSFTVKLINEDFNEISRTKEITVQQFIDLLSKDVTKCNRLKSSEIYELQLKFNLARGWDKFVKLDDSMGALEIAYDAAGDISGIGFKSVGTAGEVVLEMIIENITSASKRLDNFAQSHMTDLLNHKYFKIYISWYEEELAKGNKSLALYNLQPFGIYSIKCPTDVVVTDIDGNVVLEIINNEIVSCDSYVYAYIVNDEKYVYLPRDIEHNIEIIATDNGTMDYSVTVYTPSGLERTVKYNDVPLTKDKYYTSVAPCETMLEAEVYNLVSETGEEIEADYDSLPPTFDNIIDVVVAEELFDGFPIEIIDLVADSMFNMKSVVDLAAYDISIDDAVALFSAVAKYYPAEYSLMANSEFTYKIIVSPNLDRIMKIRFYYGDDANLNAYQKRVKDLNAEIDALVAKVDGMNDFEKALYIHDYIVLNSEYDLELLDILETNGNLTGELRSERYTEYSILVNGTGICGSYALAYRAVLNAAGMECLYLSSSQMNHGWNLVKIDGNWYHVDCCWDDPVPDYYGDSIRTYFLRTDEEMMALNHHSWSPGQYKATSKKFTNMPRNYESIQKFENDKWYYLNGLDLCSSDKYGNNRTVIFSFMDSPVDTISALIIPNSIAVEGSKIYFDYNRYIYEFDPSTSESSIVYHLELNDSGEKASSAQFVNIDVSGDDIEFYKSIVKNGRTVTYFDKDKLQRGKYVTPDSLSISQKVATLGVFETVHLTVTAIKNGEEQNAIVDWSSSNESVAQVDSNGCVVAKSIGRTTIAATVNGRTAYCTIEVFSNDLSGTCGENVQWEFVPEENKLVIFGSGAMTDYANSKGPWGKYTESIKTIEIKDGVSRIGAWAFKNHFFLNSVLIGDSVESIGWDAFKGCYGLKDVLLPESINSIESGVFAGCITLNNIIIPKSITSISRFLFENCFSLENISFNGEINTIGMAAFYNCRSLSSINLKNATIIEDDAFLGCSSLKSVYMPCVNNVGYDVFYSCTSIEELWIYNSDVLSEIELSDMSKIRIHYTDDNSTSNHVVTNYVVPNNITTINYNSLGDISTIEYLTIHDTVDSINGYPFYECSSLKEIIVDSDNPYFASIDGVLYSKDLKTLITYPAEKEGLSFEIPETVTSVNRLAFSHCKNLQNIVIPESVTSIGENTFYYCKNLQNIVIPESVNLIKTNSIFMCGALKSISVDDNNSYYSDVDGVLFNKDLTKLLAYPNGKGNKYIVPNSVTHIDKYAFYYCDNLTSVTLNNGLETIGFCSFRGSGIDKLIIPNTVRTIEYSAFIDCSNLKSLYISDLVDDLNGIYINDYYFLNCSSLEEIIVSENNSNFSSVDGVLFSKDKKTLIKYPSAKKLSTYNVPSCVTTIGRDAFKGSNLLEYVFVPNTVSTISTGAFAGCRKLNCVILPESINEILGWVFEDCVSLKSLIIPENVTKVHPQSFVGSNIEKILVKNQDLSFGSLDYNYRMGDNVDNVITPISNSTDIYCKNGSSSHKIAEIFGYGFIDIDSVPHEHSHFITNIVAPSEGSDGYEYWECYCGNDSYTVPIHYYSEVKESNATCTSDGGKYQICINCNDIKHLEVIPSLGAHDYQLTDTIPGNCSNVAVYHYTCSVCNEKITKNGKIEDSHNYVETIISPTCTEKGYTIATCSMCNETIIYDFVSPLGHKLKLSSNDTCQLHGTITYSCEKCEYVENVAAKTDNLETKIISVEPTCIKSGSKTQVCVNCNATVVTEIIRPLGHDYSNEFKIDKEATCVNDGSKSQHCSRCEAKRAVTVIEATGHQNTCIINAENPSCTKIGYTGDTYCNDCESVVNVGEKINKIAHTYSSVKTEPSCTSEGYTTHTCTSCGHVYTDQTVHKIEHVDIDNDYLCDACGVNMGNKPNCNHLCHSKSGFVGFIWKIVRFFWKLFGKNPICECGAAHY